MPSTFISQLYTKCKMHGNNDAQVLISDHELLALLKLSFNDLCFIDLANSITQIDLPVLDYYSINLDFFDQLPSVSNQSDLILSLLSESSQKSEDYCLYIQNLSALHRRRVKYRRILATQSFPTMDQISPRTLLEYGLADTNLLCNWMTWRKWMYDIDNRSAQETGYLFEPILASCLGGESCGAKNSPVKRVNSDGAQTSNGRQIDCYVASNRTAYEFKLRVTIAASGQGRFSEELSFPYECKIAGLKPVLLVLDPTPSSRLEELERAYFAADGEAYHGEEAWKKMEAAAGSTMATFIEKYIRPPLERVESFDQSLPAEVTIKAERNNIVITSGSMTYSINRG